MGVRKLGPVTLIGMFGSCFPIACVWAVALVAALTNEDLVLNLCKMP